MIGCWEQSAEFGAPVLMRADITRREHGRNCEIALERGDVIENVLYIRPALCLLSELDDLKYHGISSPRMGQFRGEIH